MLIIATIHIFLFCIGLAVKHCWEGSIKRLRVFYNWLLELVNPLEIGAKLLANKKFRWEVHELKIE